MKGDFTRSTFDRRNHYSGVRMQQGRVQIDADWNEQIDLTRKRIETEALDLIGGCGAPLDADGFRIVLTAAGLTVTEAGRPGNADVPTLAGNDDFLVTAGRMYVDGVLIENEAIVAYRGQPHLPDPDSVDAGAYVVYVDVHDRHRTALEEPDIREVALGGPDTATRTQTVWQVKLLRVDPGTTCLDSVEWETLPKGQMAAQAEESAATEDPCIVAPGAGYRALENRLYRVEVHKGGDRSVARFKWSRDNGTVVASWAGENIAEETITVSTLGRDDVLRFVDGGWVELTDDDHELRGEPGTLVRIKTAEDNVLTLDILTASGSVLLSDFPTNPRVRRWDDLITAPASGAWKNLEDGVQVAFSDGSYRVGDYWMIPARTASGGGAGDVEWPVNGIVPEPLLPHGVEHHYCRLAVMTFDATAGWSDPTDCRRLFPPVTELTSLFYVSGDGQEATPAGSGDVKLDHALRVGVANGRWPVEGAVVRFEVKHGTGTFNGNPENDITVTTGPEGTAEVSWSLGAIGEPLHAVEATLLDAAGDPMHLPIVFTARYREGALVEEPGIEVVRIMAGSANFQNDAPLAVSRLQEGFAILCDTEVESRAVLEDKPVCYVTLYVPWPLIGVELEGWGVNRPIATRPIRLDAVIGANGDTIFWRPEEAAAAWLDTLIGMVAQFGRESVLGYLNLEGNYIWSADGGREPRYLDGETFGGLRADDRTEAILPSGDGRRGGDLEMWFHLVRDEGQPQIAVSPSEVNFGTVLIGSLVNRTVVVSNGGTAGLSVTAAQFEPDEGHFLVDFSPFEVSPGASREVTVRFEPRETGVLRTVLTFTSNAGQAALTLRGRGEERVQNPARLQVLHMSSVVRRAVNIGMTQGGTLSTVVRELELATAVGFFDVDISAPTQTFDVRDAATGEVLIDPTTGAPVSISLEMQPGNAYILVLCGVNVPAFSALENVLEFAANRALVHVRPYNAISERRILDVTQSGVLEACQGAPRGPEIEPQPTTFAVITTSTPPVRDEFLFALQALGGRSVTAIAYQTIANSETSMLLIDDKGARIDPQTRSITRPTPTNRPDPILRPTRRDPILRQPGRGGLNVLGGRGLRAGEELPINRMPVTEISGVDATMASRMAELGIGSVGALAAFERDELAALLEMPKGKAAKLIKAARKAAEG